ncbi:sugar ABC transporter permease [Clostridium sp. 19966]|uniref:carbohydrate ABC transporter permease n=1 Tax=Clostridium sp. 19966 TaxID=2768166 RepID=UPI0028E03348|nr:sugar ABC transporter permease [Clostridium sp. 19966]MDT8715251.1 sugar ABC transporter permease [Clostridium sp. 19966]
MFSKLSYKKQKNILITLFLVIPLIFLITFTYIPTFNMVRYSFYDWNGFSPNKQWIGVNNYIEVFTNKDYFTVFENSVYYFVGGIIQLIIAFYLAAVLSTKTKWKNTFKALFFFPYLINSVAVSLIFIFFFRPDGTLDSILKLLGLRALIREWIGNEHIINLSLAFVSIWRYMGFNFIVFLGAIQSISSEVLEAADIDGANEWQKVRFILLPSVKRMVQLALILNVSGAISVFEIPFIMTGGANNSMTFVIQTVYTAFKFNRVGLASAMAVIVLLIVAVVTILQQSLFKEEA